MHMAICSSPSFLDGRFRLKDGIPLYKVYMMCGLYCPNIAQCYPLRSQECMGIDKLLHLIFLNTGDDGDLQEMRRYIYVIVLLRSLIISLVLCGLIWISVVIIREIFTTFRQVVHTTSNMATAILALCVNATSGVTKCLSDIVIEFWKAILAFGDVFQRAIREIWQHFTKENLSTLLALAIVLYVMPEACNIFIEILRKNAIVWGSRTTLKG